MTPLVVATRNVKKKQEILEILGDLPITLQDLSPYPQVGEVVEDGATFEANARKKAVETAQAIQQWVLAEDSGLVVPALGGRPGVLSARFAGKQGDDAANNRLLLERLHGVATAQRGAHFHCSLVLLRHATDPAPLIAEGRWFGRVLTATRGDKGFGYDPLFLPHGFERSGAEFDAEEKNRLSHRGLATAQLLQLLQQERARELATP